MMNIQNKEQWIETFFNACRGGNLEDVRHLCQKQYLDQGWADIHWFNEVGFRVACEYGHLDVIKYLLTSHELKEAGHTFANLHAANDAGFRWACQSGHMNVVKYLLTSPELKEAGHTFADSQIEEGFREACLNGHLDIVKYLMTSPELKEAGHTWADLHVNDEEGFRQACEKGHLEIVKYLLTSKELIDAGHAFADVHALDDHGFYFACQNDRWDLVRWLVIDYGIEKTSKIKEILKDYSHAQEYFRVREELKEIQEVIKKPNSFELNDSSLMSSSGINDERAAKKAKKL